MKIYFFIYKLWKQVPTKLQVVAGAETFWKSEPELEPKQIVSALQHCVSMKTMFSLL
jgi:hypothetical protein